MSNSFSPLRHCMKLLYLHQPPSHLTFVNRVLHQIIQFSHSVISDSLWPHGLQHTRLPRPSPTPEGYSNSCPSHWWCHPTISSSVVPFFFRLQSSSIKVVFSESVLQIRWPEYWSFSFSISPSNEHPGLISFRMDLLELLAVQGTLKSLLQHHSSKTDSFDEHKINFYCVIRPLKF